MKKAFTMLEMIFVIVIMSVISTMTFGMIAQFYEAYIQKEAAGQLETETKVMVEQIAAHLQNAIKESVVVLGSSSNCVGHISNVPSSTTLPGIAWVGENVEGRLGVWDATKGQYMPGWSGYADLNQSDTIKIVTTGSDLTNLETIIDDLSGNSGSLSNNFSAVYFVGDGTIANACDEFINYNIANKFPTFMYPINSFLGSTLKFDTAKQPTTIKEHYKLAWSAYAIVLNGTNLELVYNFRPWSSTKNTIALGDRTTLGENISTFAVKYESGLIRFNVCITKDINGYPTTVCKEKVVF
jgi:prepilin-type N-terminal cleavage/methylation domain-containing protein